MDVVIKIPCGTKAHTYIPILVSFAWRHPSRSLLPVFHIDFGDLKHAGRGVEPCQDRHASLWWCDGGGCCAFFADPQSAWGSLDEVVLLCSRCLMAGSLT